MSSHEPSPYSAEVTARPPPRGELTPAAIIASVIVAIIMGSSYPYMVLKLGFGPNVSVVAAFFGFVVLKAIAWKTYDRWQNNIVQTAGTSAAQTAFMCVLLAAFDMLRHADVGFALELNEWKSFVWLSIAGLLGVLLAVPLRRHFIVDEKLPYADGIAAAETLIVLDPEKDASAERKQLAVQAAWALMIGLVLSGLVMLVREDAKVTDWLKEGWVPAVGVTVAGLPLVAMGVGVSYSLLSIGSGMLIGLRVDWSMILGGVLAWIVTPYFLIKYGVSTAGGKVFSASSSRTDVLFWVMWPATGMLVAGGLTALALKWRLLIETFTSLKTMTISGADFPLSWVGIGVGVCSVLLCTVQYLLFDIPIWMTVVAILLSLPLMLVGLRVLGETSWGPISALSNMMQGLFAAVAPGHVAANMVASGTTGTVATSSEAIMQDYKTGDMIGSTPRAMTWAQLMAVPIGAACVSWIYPQLVSTYGLDGTGDARCAGGSCLSSPISRKWAGFATILKKGVSALPTSALWALAIFSVLGVILTVLEAKPKLRRFVPSPTGIGIGILVPFSVIATMFLGGLAGIGWKAADKRSYDKFMVPLASGFIAGEALVATIVAIYFIAAG
ncbi:MAG: OPT/YSL family transporter [Myxococcales bacterium]|nr:OPT/YSL family transporter [Myxococcales bacterium]